MSNEYAILILEKDEEYQYAKASGVTNRKAEAIKLAIFQLQEASKLENLLKEERAKNLDLQFQLSNAKMDYTILKGVMQKVAGGEYSFCDTCDRKADCFYASDEVNKTCVRWEHSGSV